MSPRITAWMALLAILSGVSLPLHAYAQHWRAGGPGSDFCAAGKTSNSAPAVPERAHRIACDMCCANAGAMPASLTATAVGRAGFVAERPAALWKHGAANFGSALPRGPPLLA